MAQQWYLEGSNEAEINNCVQQSQPEVRCVHVRAVTNTGDKVSVSQAVFDLPTGSFHTHPCCFVCFIIVVMIVGGGSGVSYHELVYWQLMTVGQQEGAPILRLLWDWPSPIIRQRKTQQHTNRKGLSLIRTAGTGHCAGVGQLMDAGSVELMSRTPPISRPPLYCPFV